ncbi:MAG TPA: acyl-CoA dehydrogenase family protein [Rhizomicrobium sp.]|nr:acyl-CoA dehydrogenase family protein [Rhizomicrobium sp.]
MNAPFDEVGALKRRRGAIIANARALSVQFAKEAAHHDRSGEFPFANFDHLARAGILSFTIDPRFGGSGAGLSEALAVVGEIARGDPATALVLSMHYIQHAAIARNPSFPAALGARLKRESVEGIALINGIQVEPELGSPSRGGLPKTIARRDGDAWVISGHKLYATGAPILGWFNVWAITDEDQPRIGNFFVPAGSAGLTIIRTWDAIGMRATGSEDVLLQEVRVPLEHAVDLRPAGLPVQRNDAGRGWYFGMLAAVYNGVAVAARDWLVDFLKARAPASLGAPLSTVPRIQEAVGTIEGLLAANGALLRTLGDDTDADVASGLGGAGLVKNVVTNNAIEVTTLALALCGNHGLSQGNALERHHRNALCGRIHAPQDDTIRIAAGKAALGL